MWYLSYEIKSTREKRGGIIFPKEPRSGLSYPSYPATHPPFDPSRTPQKVENHKKYFQLDQAVRHRTYKTKGNMQSVPVYQCSRPSGPAWLTASPPMTRGPRGDVCGVVSSACVCVCVCASEFVPLVWVGVKRGILQQVTAVSGAVKTKKKKKKKGKGGQPHKEDRLCSPL